MKRALILFFIPAALLRLPALAQDTTVTPTPTSTVSTAAAIAAKEDAEDRYKRMAADLQAVQSDNEALHGKITAMEQEIQALRDAQAKVADNSGVQDELKRLAQAIQEVDKKRLEDKDAISEEIRKTIGHIKSTLGGETGTSLPPVHSSEPKISSAKLSAAVENGFSYTIQSGDTLGEIVRAYNKDFKSKGLKTISLRQAMEANPNVDWGRLKVGQKIVIPRPDGG